MVLFCVNCQKEVLAEYENNSWKCPHCNNSVGCHKGTNRPLGCIPSPELRLKRIELYSLMEPLFSKISKLKLLKLLSEKLGYKFHLHQVKSIKECERVIDLVVEIGKELNG